MSDPRVLAAMHRAAPAAGRSALASRRDVARALAGLGLGGGWPALHGGDPLQAKKGRGKKRCKGGKKRCGRRCIPQGECCKSGDCAPGERCAQGRCVVGLGSCAVGDDICVDETATCGGGACFCFRTMSDATRCGSAGTLGGAGACADDGDCAALFPDVPGAFCVKAVGPNCVNSGVCIGPCGVAG